LSNAAVTIEKTKRKARRTRKTRQQIEKELLEIEHRICHGLTDKEIMEELDIKERRITSNKARQGCKTNLKLFLGSNRF
jgi:FixJ family two-component response regulator